MSNEPVITIVGNLTDAPELRFLPQGDAVAAFTVAQTPRIFDKAKNEWVDGEALFMRCSLWRKPGENAAECLVRGQRVIVQGRLKARSFETELNGKRTVTELEVDEIGPSIRYGTARFTKTPPAGDSGVGVAWRPSTSRDADYADAPF